MEITVVTDLAYYFRTFLQGSVRVFPHFFANANYVALRLCYPIAAVPSLDLASAHSCHVPRLLLRTAGA
jgi:hypothetical protein